jgi:hypothetical protein
LADISHPLIFEALTRAAAAPRGLPLYVAKAGPGLFAATAAGKAAAQRCKDDGLLAVLSEDVRGKASHEVCGITDRGTSWLAQHSNPHHVLSAFVQALSACESQLQAILAEAGRSQQDLAALKQQAARVLDHLELRNQIPPGMNGQTKGPDLAAAIHTELSQRHAGGALDDCPLPELFRRLQPTFAQLTVGRFHDELRLLHQAQQLYLHPWTGPLYELPEPTFALLVGHEVAYYASARA